ncbi:unnamed protein product [Oikopleura dioica]|uniref:Uncharacterized protein n=1 Tax=Oikopleura dioica TaxID=34765 RepID=E4X7L7_OIKDI|nr:unnamed protein product [Oikopleura dioica]
MRRSMDSPFKDRKAQLSIIREYKLSYDKMKREFPEDEEVIETKEESLNPVSCLRTTCGGSGLGKYDNHIAKQPGSVDRS